MIGKRRNARGELRYQVRLYDDQGVKRTYGTFRTEREAKRREAALLVAPERSKTVSVTCDEQARRYADGERWNNKPVRSSTSYTNHYALKPFVRRFRGVPLDALGQEDAREFAEAYPRAAELARSVFNDAMRRGLVDRNPFALLHYSRGHGRRDVDVISLEQLYALGDAAVATHGREYGPVFRAAVLFSAFSGLRLGELCRLRRSWVDFDAAEIHVRRSLSRTGEETLPKNGRERTVVLLPEARDALLSMPRSLNSEFMFYAKRGGPLSHSALFPLWNPVRAAAGLVDLDWHGLRHWCGHHFYVTLGFEDELAAYQLGHSDVGEIRRYGHGQQGALGRLKRGVGNVRVLRNVDTSRTHEAADA